MNPHSFAHLVTSRKAWLNDVLKPWCRQARVADLKLAELEWLDIAGKVSPETTLWLWAWSRFPELVNDELGKIDETHEVRVDLLTGETLLGYPDARASHGGELVLVGRLSDGSQRFGQIGPLALDAIRSLTRVVRT